ncbi:hypothetical protein JL720_13846 [Aureococcus anophagefferens]|nr:hypothetical protein JL720_13846 [Aureococcus anophagefferens]
MDALDTEPPGEDDALIASRVRFLAGLACLNSVALGFQIGAVSAAAPLIQDTYDLNSFQLEMYEAAISAAAILGAVLAGVVSEPVGRLKAFQISSVLFIAGSLMQAVSFGYYMLMVGVCIVGVAVGFASASTDLHRGDLAPGDRGYFVTWSEIAITGGQVLGFAAGLVIEIIFSSWIAPAEASVVGLLTQRRALKPAVKRILLVGVGAAVAQQLSGCDAIFYNFLFSLEAVGINSTWISYSILLGLGVRRGRRDAALVLALFYAFCTTLKGNVAYQAGIIFFYYVYIFVFELGLGRAAG